MTLTDFTQSSVPTAVQENGSPSTAAKNIRTLLSRYQSEIAKALPSHLSPVRMARMALTEFRKNPELERCTPESFLGAVIQAAQLGLEPGNGLGQAYLVPFKGEVQLIPGYKGLIELAYRSGFVLNISADVVYEKDDFEIEKGDNQRLYHKPAKLPPSQRGELIAFYSVINMKNGGCHWEFLWKEEVDVVKNKSPGAKRSNSPWNTNFVEMGKKTAIRRALKLIPKSAELAIGLTLDNTAESDESQHNEEVLLSPIANDVQELENNKN